MPQYYAHYEIHELSFWGLLSLCTGGTGFATQERTFRARNVDEAFRKAEQIGREIEKGYNRFVTAVTPELYVTEL